MDPTPDPEQGYPSALPGPARKTVEIPFGLFENRNVPLTEQKGLFFEGDLPPLRSLRTAWLLALFLGFTGVDRFYLRRPVTGEPVAGTITATVTAVNALLNPVPPPPIKEWVTVGEASGTKPPGPVVTVTGKLHIEYAFTGPAVAYLQPPKGPAITILSRVKAAAGATGGALPPGTYTLIVSTTGTVWHLTAEEYRLPG